MASIHTAANQIAETSTPIEPGDTGEIARNETGVIIRATGPEAAERGGGGGGAIHGDLDSENRGGEGHEHDAGGKKEDHEAHNGGGDGVGLVWCGLVARRWGGTGAEEAGAQGP